MVRCEHPGPVEILASDGGRPVDVNAGGERPAKFLTVRQAAFIGVGAMVGAGIFALLGAAGEVAGAAVWLSFLIAGCVAGLQGYSFAKLGARFPTAGGLLEYVAKGFGAGHVTGVTAWLTYSANAIVTAMVAVNPALLTPSEYPPLRDIVSSVALTFFAFLGFGIITFTAKDLARPTRQLPRAMFLALGIASAIYVAIALGVFGTLAVDTVIASGGTALAVAAEPALGAAGYWLMSVTALFATAGATNAGLYPAAGLSERLAGTGQFPPLMGRRLGGRVSAGLLVEAVACLVLALVFQLTAIASIGSAVALLIFVLVTAAHLRVRAETGANALLLGLAIAAAGVVLVTFVVTDLIHEPASMVTLLVILALSVVLDLGWKRSRAGG